MRIGVPRETRPGETRVAATPKTVEAIRGLGYAVFVEQGAGALSSFDDAAYLRAGADVIDEAGLERRRAAQDQRAVGGRDRAAAPGPGRGVAARARPEPRRWCRPWPLVGSRRWRWMPCHASRAPSRSTCCRRWPTSAATARWSRPPTSSGRSSPARSPRRARCRRPRCWSSAPGVAGLAAIGTASLAGRGGAGVRRAVPRWASRSSRWGRSSCASTSRQAGPSADGYAKETSADFDAKAARAVRRAGRRRRHPHHHGPDPGPAGAAADHRGHGGLDEARLGRRRHGGLQRRQRRRHRSPTRRWSPPTASRSWATPTCRGGCPPRPRSCSAPTWSTCSSW